MAITSQGFIAIPVTQRSALNVSAATVIKSSAGYVGTVNVTTAGAAGALYDNTSTSTGNTAANLIATVPATAGPLAVNFPFKKGLVYVPGASQVASIAFA